MTANFGYFPGRRCRVVKPENILFHDNLQEFGYRASILSNLATGGKLSLEDAFDKIEQLWEKLSDSKQELGIGESSNRGRRGTEDP